MKRSLRLLVAGLAIAAAITGVAAAAAAPTVATRLAAAVTTHSAVLRGAVNPNGSQTGYVFQYGPTTAYGLGTPSHSAGHGVKPRAVRVVVTGLNPGTTYHYRIVALNSHGVTAGHDRQFRTAGHPPADVLTGPAVDVGKNSAIVTGSINPRGQRTTWSVQYGLTATYTAQTIGQTPLPAIRVPFPVSVGIGGLAPGTVYHYRIVASHPIFTTVGADQTFFTAVRFRRKPNMTTRTTPKHATHRPFVFTTAGTLHGFTFIPQNLRCTGRVGIRYYHGKRQVAFVLVPVGSNCRFSTPVSFSHRINGRSAKLDVKIFYRGNAYLRTTEKTDHNIRLG
jgi:hypothetical protein